MMKWYVVYLISVHNAHIIVYELRLVDSRKQLAPVRPGPTQTSSQPPPERMDIHIQYWFELAFFFWRSRAREWVSE